MIKPIVISDKMWQDFTSQFDSVEILGLMDEVCQAVKNDDLSESVMVILSKLKHFCVQKQKKSEEKSNEFRLKGNKAYVVHEFQDALVYYNQALLYAPFKSHSMKLAYSNRSAIFLNVNCAGACYKDIDTCFSLGCPDDIRDKLLKRKDQAKNLFVKEQFNAMMCQNEFTDSFFQKKLKHNTQVPCCSTDVDVIIDNGKPKVIARTNIKAGTVLAVETAFISETEFDNVYFSCSYCHKMALNLKPCRGCTCALFCDATCEKLALQEYHDIECALGDLDIPKAYYKMFFKAALKMKNKCNSWKQFIDASYIMGYEQIKNSNVNEIFSVNNQFSMLSFKDDRHFVNGPRCSISVLIAMVIHNLKKVSFFPTTELEQPAIRAFTRVLMYLFLYVPKTQKLPSVASTNGHTMLHKNTNFGIFSFISKLKNACPGNCITIDLNKKQALIAMNPISAGTELTTPYCDPWIDITPMEMFTLYNTVSDCRICTKEKNPPNVHLTKEQENALFTVGMVGLQTNDHFDSTNVEKIYKMVCGFMPLFANVPHTDEYKLVYGTFRKCLLYMQDMATKNVVLVKFQQKIKTNQSS